MSGSWIGDDVVADVLEEDAIAETDLEPDADVEEMAERRRIKEIFTARQQFIKAHHLMYLARHDGVTDRRRGGIYLLRLVQTYISLIEPMVRRSDLSADYWNAAEIGEFVIPPPDEILDYFDDGGFVMASERPEPVYKRVIGLRSVVELEEIAQAEFTAEVKSPPRERGVHRAVGRRAIPAGISVKAFRVANQALAELGLAPTFDDTGGDAEIPETHLK